MDTTPLAFYYRKYSHHIGVASYWSHQQKIHATHRSIPICSFCLSFFYLYFLLKDGGLGEADFSSLEGCFNFFHQATPEAAAAGWMHYLAFDFWVGCWLLRDAQEKQLPHGLIILPLLFTLMMGPVGILLYVVFSQTLSKKKQ